MHIIITSGRQKISGELRQKQPSKQLLVICHGYKSSRDQPAQKAIAQQLYKKGHAVFTFNFSDDKTGLNLPQQVRDIEATIAHFKNYPEIILLAGSFGALSTSIAAATAPKIKSLVTLNGFFGKAQLGGEARRNFIAFRLLKLVKPQFRAIWRFYKEQFRPDKIGVPVLVIHSKVDQVIPMAQSQDFFAALPGKKQFSELERSDHEILVGDEIGSIVQIIDDWIRSL
jgi:hypothetical protein